MQMYPLSQNDAPVDGTLASCGVTALWGLQGVEPKDTVDRVLRERLFGDKQIREAFVVFSDVDYGTNTRGGYFLAKYIKENKIGTIMETETRMNPNTGNPIKVWVWSPPHTSLEPKDKYLPKKDHKRAFYQDGRFSRYIPNGYVVGIDYNLNLGERLV